MISSRFMRQSLLMLLVWITAGCASMTYQSEYQPEINQPGKDVAWWPTAQELVNKMLDIAKVTPEDYVIDLGSGDGRLVITAAKRGARALGIEYNHDLVAVSKRNAAKEGVTDKAQFIVEDIFESDFSQATVITMFLSEIINRKLRQRILDLRPGTRIVSNTFTMGEWTADKTVTLENNKECGTYCTAYLWVVPANVEGVWRFLQSELTLTQSFQTFSGALRSGNNTVPLTNGKLNGDLINFNAGHVKYTGRVSGGTIEGIYESGGTTAKWNATKVGKGL